MSLRKRGAREKSESLPSLKEEDQQQFLASKHSGTNDNVLDDDHDSCSTEQSKPAPLKPPFSLQRCLQHYVKFTSSAANADRTLKILQWSVWLVSYSKRQQSVATATTTTKSAAWRKLYLDLSFARYALRLLGFPTALEAALSGSWGSGSSYKNTLVNTLGKVMAYAMMGYYPTEHLAFLKWTSPQLIPDHTIIPPADMWSAYSCRCWLVYLVAEMTQCVLKLKELHQQKHLLLCHRDSISMELMEENRAALCSVQQSIRNERLQLIRSLLFTLPCIHWSLPKWSTDPWLKEGVVNGLMWVESVVSMYQSISAYQR